MIFIIEIPFVKETQQAPEPEIEDTKCSYEEQIEEPNEVDDLEDKIYRGILRAFREIDRELGS